MSSRRVHGGKAKLIGRTNAGIMREPFARIVSGEQAESKRSLGVMMRYVAFLRAINVGGRHLVKMDQLRQLFESLGFSGVETFIASGNVLFETASKNAKALEKKIETKLRETLGYEVVTFLRTEAELAELASYQPFGQSDLQAAVALNVVFLGDQLGEASTQKLMALKTDLDDFKVNGREIYWLIRTRQSDSPISNAVLTKALGMPSTIRGVNTVKRMAAKYSGPKK